MSNTVRRVLNFDRNRRNKEHSISPIQLNVRTLHIRCGGGAIRRHNINSIEIYIIFAR